MNHNNGIVTPFLILLPILLTACSSTSIGEPMFQLKPCPSSPNCVSTDTANSKQQIIPFKIKGSEVLAWEELQRQITHLPRTQIITVTSDYLHAESRSALFGFVDDLEFQLREEQREIAIRSAARTGYSDFGVNRKRIEILRAELVSRGVIE